MAIRDFIYLDIERVRSFYAQISKGLPTERTIEKGTEFGTDGSVEGNVLFAKGKVNTDYRYIRSNTETSSLHDYIMEEFLEKLRDSKLLLEFPNKDFKWQEEAFTDGMFILTRGTIKILDYKYIVASLSNLPKLMKLIHQITNTAQPSQAFNVKDVEKQLKGLSINEIAKFIEQNMQDSLRVKIYPQHYTPSQYFLASANDSFFRYSTVSLVNMYGHTINANWSCLIQVNRGSQVESVGKEFFPPVGVTDLESALETVANSLTDIHKFMQGVQFPTIAVTPIAIFREIFQDKY